MQYPLIHWIAVAIMATLTNIVIAVEVNVVAFGVKVTADAYKIYYVLVVAWCQI